MSLNYLNNNSLALFYQYLSYLTHFAPLPKIGSIVTYSFPNEVEFKIKSNALNELPFCCENYVFNFFYNRIMSIENFHEVLYWFLCQTGKPVLISSDVTKIIATVETLKTVIFPFEYDEQYVPNLPDSLNELLGTDFIYPLGKIRAEQDSLDDIYEEASELTLFVLLDKDQLMVKLGGEEVYFEQYKASYSQSEEHKVQFSSRVLPNPDKLKTISSCIEKSIGRYEKGIRGTVSSEQCKHNLIYEIREAYLGYFLDLFGKYSNYLIEPKD